MFIYVIKRKKKKKKRTHLLQKPSVHKVMNVTELISSIEFQNKTNPPTQCQNSKTSPLDKLDGHGSWRSTCPYDPKCLRIHYWRIS